MPTLSLLYREDSISRSRTRLKKALAAAGKPDHPLQKEKRPPSGRRFFKKVAAKGISFAAIWLRNKDSNLDKQCQRLSCYHYTIPQYRRERYYYIEFSAFVKGVLKQILPEIKKNIHSYRLTTANLIFFCQSLASIAKDKMTARRAIAFRAAVA